MTLEKVLITFVIILVLSLITGILLTVYEKKKLKNQKSKTPMDDSPTIVMNFEEEKKEEQIPTLTQANNIVENIVAEEAPKIEENKINQAPVVEELKEEPTEEQQNLVSVDVVAVPAPRKNKNLEFNSQLVLIPFESNDIQSDSTMDLI